MAQSLNKTVEFHTTRVSYRWGKGWKNPNGNAAFEFYADANVEDYIKFPGRKSGKSNPIEDVE